MFDWNKEQRHGRRLITDETEMKQLTRLFKNEKYRQKQPSGGVLAAGTLGVLHRGVAVVGSSASVGVCE